MKVVADSHALIFSLFEPARLSEIALDALLHAEDSEGIDPETNFNVAPVLVETMEHFDRVPLVDLGDPFDRFILATAAQLRLPLVTADRAIALTRTVQVIW